MSIEKPPQQKESPDGMKAFREEVRHIMEAEKVLQQTAHFSPIKSLEEFKEFLDSLTEDDRRWFEFAKEAQLQLLKDTKHLLSTAQVNEYQEKIEEFRQTRGAFTGSREIWYEFLANKLNVLAMKLFILQTQRGKER